MQLGRARNCDLVLSPSPHDGVLRFSRPTSAAFRVAAYVEVLAARGVDIAVVEVDNPRRPQPAELVSRYEPAAGRLVVPDVALDAGSHIPPGDVLCAQFNVHAAVGMYLLSPPPGPSAVDLAALVPACPAASHRGLADDFALRYARKEVRMTAPASALGCLEGAGVHPRPGAPARPGWEAAVAAALGPGALDAARRALDAVTDGASSVLDAGLERVLSSLAAEYPVLDQYAFHVPPDAAAGRPAPADTRERPAGAG